VTAALTGTWGWPVVRALAVAGAVPELDYDDAVELLLLIEAVGRITEALNE
jgi:hypothetical protein